VEQVFSRAGLLSDPNMDPDNLSLLVRVGVNKSTYKPLVDAIKTRYFDKYRGGGDEGDEEGEASTSPHTPDRASNLMRTRIESCSKKKI
jgi:hypothetical protein